MNSNRRVEMLQRPRRNRHSDSVRALVRETKLSAQDFIAPLFVLPGAGRRLPIKSMPGQDRLSLDLVLEEIDELVELGIRGVCLFPVIEEARKNSQCTEATNPACFYYDVLRQVRARFPELLIMTDVALDPYNSDGHDGLVDPASGKIVNDATVALLARMSVLQAEAGANCIGPSDMMDGRVGAIRRALEESGHHDVMILSYTAKYASAFYGPFRDALDSAPRHGDKKSYQMDPANVREALRELALDEAEGADVVMVKPALSYLDVIARLRQHTHLPIAAYNVSGEYAMIKSAHAAGMLDGEKAMLEMLLSIKRAGADIILTYFAKEAARLL
jgi:porphobilinogen synthase